MLLRQRANAARREAETRRARCTLSTRSHRTCKLFSCLELSRLAVGLSTTGSESNVKNKGSNWRKTRSVPGGAELVNLGEKMLVESPRMVQVLPWVAFCTPS